jgi:D-3-phosphoglycerate dehydrogenase
MNDVSKFTVLVTARSFGKNDPLPVHILEQNGCIVVRSGSDRPLQSAELVSLIAEADALIAGNDQVDAKVIAAGKNLKIISRYGVGIDNIDLTAATAKGIPVTNTPGTNEHSVADLVFALMLSVARQIPEVTALVRAGGWDRRLGTEVWGKTLGIIGFGKIGKGVARRARGFNMNVLVNDVLVDKAMEKEHEVTFVSREDVIRQSDFLSLHAPCTPETMNMIGVQQLNMMKPGAIVINTARGGLIDESALAEAIEKGIIAGAALDVLEHEPPKSRALLELKNVQITSHIGGYTAEAVNAMSMLAAENVVKGLAGKRLDLVVNPEIYKD